LLADWWAVGQYFMTCTYSIQEVIYHLRWRGTPQALALSGLALALVMGVAYLGRRGCATRQLSFLGVGSALWTYHLIYDYVSLLPALMLGMGWRPASDSTPAGQVERFRIGGVLLFLQMSATFTPAVGSHPGLPASLMRWTLRVALVYLLMRDGWLLMRTRSSENREGYSTALSHAGCIEDVNAKSEENAEEVVV
jgi:hypothetical protein